MLPQVAYDIFINFFNVSGTYSKKYAPRLPLEGSNLKCAKTWMDDNSEEKLISNESWIAIFKSPDTTSEIEVNQHIEQHQITHLLARWTDNSDHKGHAVGLSIIKDKLNNYHVSYLNKGYGTLDRTWYWFYIPNEHKAIIQELISALKSEDANNIEELIKKIIFLKKSVSVYMPQPVKHKRGTCVVSNSIKNMLRVEAIMKTVESMELGKYLSSAVAEEVCLDTETSKNFRITYKKKLYHQAWLSAYYFTNLFENAQHENRISYGILLYQGLSNRFNKERYKTGLGFKLSSELAEMTAYFDRCLGNTYHQPLFIMLFHFVKSNAARRMGKQSLEYFIKKLAENSGGIIYINKELLDLMVLDILRQINQNNLTQACAMYSLLDQFICPPKNSLYFHLKQAVMTDNVQSFNLKLSSPLNMHLFEQFKLLTLLDKLPEEKELTTDQVDRYKFILDDSKSSNHSRPLLHIAVELNKSAMVKHLLKLKASINELDEHKKTALDIAAECGHITIYTHLLELAPELFNNSLTFAAEYENFDFIKSILKQHLDKIDFSLFLYLFSYKEVFSGFYKEIFDNAALSSDFIFKLICATIKVGDIGLIEHCLDKKTISINQEDNLTRRTLLHFAAYFGKVELFNVLLKYKPNIFVHDVEGMTPFGLALKTANSTGHFGILNYYLDNYFKSLTEVELLLCLTKAVLYCQIDMASKILSQHTFNHKDIQQLLKKATSRGIVKIANMLKDKGAQLNECDADGVSPMHMAMASGDRILAWASENGGDIYLQNPQCKMLDFKPLINFASLSSFKYLFIQVLDKQLKLRSSAKQYWSFYRDPITEQLVQLANLIKQSLSPELLGEACKKWGDTPYQNSTKKAFLFAIPSIKTAIEPFLNRIIEYTEKQKPHKPAVTF